MSQINSDTVVQTPVNPDLSPLTTNLAPLPTVATVEDVKAHDPEADLLAVRNIRAKIVNHLGQRGVPSDIRETQVLLATLQQMDQAALGRMRIKVDEKQADLAEVHRQTALAVLDYSRSLRDKGEVIDVIPIEKRAAPVLGDEVITRDFVPGEAVQGTVHETFEQFQARTGISVSLAKTDSPD